MPQSKVALIPFPKVFQNFDNVLDELGANFLHHVQIHYPEVKIVQIEPTQREIQKRQEEEAKRKAEEERKQAAARAEALRLARVQEEEDEIVQD